VKPFRVEQFVFGEAPEASNTGFRVLGHSTGLDAHEVTELEQRANVGPTLASDKRQFRHFAHDHLSSGRHAWSVRVRTLTQKGEQKLINHILVTEPNEIRHLPDAHSLLSSPVREPCGSSLEQFRETEGYRGQHRVVTLPALILEPPPKRDRGELLREAWRELTTVGDSKQAIELLSSCLDRLGHSRVRLVHENAQAREAIIHLVTLLLPIIDGMRLTWSTLASPRQWADYDLCAVIPHEKGYIEGGVIVEGAVPESPNADARHILQWLEQGSNQLEDLLNGLDKSKDRLFGAPTITQWVRYQELFTRDFPVTAESIPREFELFREPAISEPGWLSPAPVARRIAAAIAAMDSATRSLVIEGIAVELEPLRPVARKALFTDLIKELRKSARIDCVMQLMSALMIKRSALSGACVGEIDLRADVPYLKGHGAAWANLKQGLLVWLRLGQWSDSDKDTWIQLLVYASQDARDTRALFEELNVTDALRAGALAYSGVPEAVSEMAEVATRRAVLEQAAQIDAVFSWASDRNPNAARRGLLDALTKCRIDKETPFQFAARIVGHESPATDVLDSWTALVQRWLPSGDHQIATLVRQAPANTWAVWWAKPLSAVSDTTPATFAAIFGREDSDRVRMLRALYMSIAAAATRKDGAKTIIECASVAEAHVAESLEHEAVSMRLYVGFSVLIEGVLRPSAARRWQAAIRSIILEHREHALHSYWKRLRERYPVFADDLAEQVAGHMTDDEIQRFLNVDDQSVTRGVRRSLMFRSQLPADAHRRFERVWSRGPLSFASALDKAVENLVRSRSAHQS